MHDVDADALLRFCRRLQIVNQNTGAITPFEPNEEQRAVIALVTSSRESIILKSRQVGISTVLLAHDLAFGIANPGVPASIALDTDDNAKKMLGLMRQWCERDLGMRLRVATEHVIVLPNGSRFQALTSGSRAANGQSRTGRSGTAGLIHCSELAFWANDQRTFQSLTSTALVGCRVVVESTATPSNNLFRKLWARAQEGANGFASLFLPLEMHAAYRADPASISDERWEALRQQEGFSRRDTAAWFEAQLQGRFAGDVHGLRQEYPPTAQAAFSHAVGRWIFSFVPVEPVRVVGKWSLFREITEIDEPVAMGVDVAKGTGGDFSCIVVLGFESRDVVAVWYDNLTPIPSFVDVLRDAMTRFRPMATSIESNGIGAAVYQEAAGWGFPGLAEQTSSKTNGEKHMRLTRLKWSIERGVTRAPPVLRAEIEGSDDVPGSTVDENGDFVGRDDAINAASFALKAIEANPWARPAKPVDPHTYLAPTFLRQRPRRATGI